MFVANLEAPIFLFCLWVSVDYHVEEACATSTLWVCIYLDDNGSNSVSCLQPMPQFKFDSVITANWYISSLDCNILCHITCGRFHIWLCRLCSFVSWQLISILFLVNSWKGQTSVQASLRLVNLSGENRPLVWAAKSVSGSGSTIMLACLTMHSTRGVWFSYGSRFENMSIIWKVDFWVFSAWADLLLICTPSLVM